MGTDSCYQATDKQTSVILYYYINNGGNKEFLSPKVSTYD